MEAQEGGFELRHLGGDIWNRWSRPGAVADVLGLGLTDGQKAWAQNQIYSRSVHGVCDSCAVLSALVSRHVGWIRMGD